MALKPIVDIDVRTGSFQRFQVLWDRYQAALTATPGKWHRVGEAQAGLASNFQRQTAALMAQAQLAREQAEADEKQSKSLKQADRLWISMAKSTKSVAGNVVSATTALLRWTGLLSAVGGLLGAGGLFGIDRMAANVANQRRTGMGLGMSPGEQQAFKINFGRMVDTDSFLETINEARANPAEAWRLATLGVSTSGSTSDVALRALDAMRARARATPENQIGLLGTQTGMDVGTDTWRRLHDMSPQEYAAQRAHYAQDLRSFSTSPNTNQAWQDLSSQFSRAGTTLFDAFQTRIGQLAPDLTNLSGKLTKLGTSIINSPFAKDAVTAIGHGLDWLAEKLDSPEFQAKVENFFSEDGPLATAIHRFSDAVGKFVDEVSDDLPLIAKAIHVVAHPLETAEQSDNALIRVPAKGVDLGLSAIGQEATEIGDLAGAAFDRQKFLAHPTKKAYLSRLDELTSTFKLPTDLLRFQWQQESSSTFNPPDSKKGAIGPFQLMPDAAKDIGDRFGLPVNPRDPLSSAFGAAEYDQYLLSRYHGDVKKALAAYDMGMGKLDAVLKAHPDDWARYLPSETQGYLDSYSRRQKPGMQAQGSGVRVEINNNTGGSATASVNQLAY